MGTTEQASGEHRGETTGPDDADGARSARANDDAPIDLPDETPPGPDGLPVLGSTLEFVRDPWSYYDVLAEHGDVVSYRVAWFDMVAALHPDHVERVLVTDSELYSKTQFGAVGVDFAPDGLVFAEGEQWRAQRTILQDAFTLDRIRRYGERMVDVAEAHVADWDDGQAVVLNEAYSQLTLDVLTRTLFDLDLGERGDVVTRVARALNDRGDLRNFSTFLPSWVPTRTQRRYDRAMDDFDAMVDELIAERRAALDAAGVDVSDVGGGSDATGGSDTSDTSDGSADPNLDADALDGRDDLLSILLAAGGPGGYTHDDEELRDQLLTFLFAGHDTTSLGLTYTTLLLAQHDDVLERLRAEWDDVIGDRPPRPADVPQLEYTDRVLTEALRLYPPVPVLIREPTRDVELGGYRVPEGSKVVLPQFRLHTDERFYDEPARFDPDRWTDEFEVELPDYAYFPFGGGPRHCIGMRFARTELKLVLPTVLRAVDVDLLSDPEPEMLPGATSQPVEDVRVRVSRR